MAAAATEYLAVVESFSDSKELDRSVQWCTFFSASGRAIKNGLNVDGDVSGEIYYDKEDALFRTYGPKKILGIRAFREEARRGIATMMNLDKSVVTLTSFVTTTHKLIATTPALVPASAAASPATYSS